MKEQPSYYAILTAEVRYSKVLKPMEKLMFAEITVLTNTTGECFATNRYFAELYDVGKVTVSKWIANLEKQGFITRRIKYKVGTKEIEKRFISLTNPIVQKDNTPHDQKDNTPIVQKAKGNSTSFNSSSFTPEFLIDNFKPTLAALKAIEDVYGVVSNKSIQLAIDEFKAEAEGRDNPFQTERGIQAGFNKYIRKHYLKALEETRGKKKTHAQMSKQIRGRMNGKVIPAPKTMKEIEHMLEQKDKRRQSHG